uniref:Ubiquitin-like domain-containing protein n=1 Tax=Salarias fasciatus TaxID=181472 RepID=A0A672GH60_SALFA
LGKYIVIVYGVNKEKMTIDVCDAENELKKVTLNQLKQKIARRLPGNGESAMTDMKLIFAGERLEGDKPLSEYGLVHRSTIQLVMTLDGGLTT